MTDKELRRLRREDLLQILIAQQRRLDEQADALKRAEEALARRDVAVAEAGSLAEAALRLNGVFEAAQAAADQYDGQVRARADKYLAEAKRRLEEATAEAQRILAEARARAGR